MRGWLRMLSRFDRLFSGPILGVSCEIASIRDPRTKRSPHGRHRRLSTHRLGFCAADLGRHDGGAVRGVLAAAPERLDRRNHRRHSRPADAGAGLPQGRDRVIATVIGVVASFVIAGLFPQTRELFIVGFAGWLGLCVYAGGLLDGNRAYGAVLS